MGEVYTKAYTVTAWIGDEYENSREAFNLIHGYEIELAREDAYATENYIASFVNREEEPCRWAFWQLLDRPWFRRIWIIQEIVLAKNVGILCGGSYCTWNGLVGLVAGLGQYGLVAFLGTSGGKWLLTISTIRESFYQSQEGLELEYLLGRTRHFQSTVPHDRIYGLTALLKKEVKDDIIVDSEQPVATFYNSVVIGNMKSRQDLDLLSMGGYFSQTSDLDIPTWSCNWSVDHGIRDTVPLFLLNYDAGKLFACGARTQLDIRVYTSGKVSNIAGYEFESIVDLQPNSLLDNLPPSKVNAEPGKDVKDVNQTEIWPQIELLKVFAQKSLPYPDNLELSVVWPRLLVCDQGLEDKVEPSESYFQISYRLLEAGMSRCDPSGHISKANEVDPEVQQTVNEVARCEDPGAVILQAIGYGAGLGGLIANRKLCLTSGRYLGLVPCTTEVGDVIAIFKGAKLPFVLRPLFRSIDRSFMLIGECYIHGIMYGEAIKKGGIKEQTFCVH
jgi:hypothetical protein